MDLAHDILPCALPDQARDATPPEFGGALLESRQRWRDFALLAADLAFETDAEGRWTFLSPAVVLGWPCGTLLEQPARELLLHPEPDPFRPRTPARGLRAWLRQASGAPACLSISVAPLIDAEGRLAGLRGIARDVTAEAEEAEAQATALRRAQVLETLVRRVRRQVLASRMLAATLESLMPALGCAGVSVIEMGPGGMPQAIHRHGADPGPMLAVIRPLTDAGRPCYPEGPTGEKLALLPHPQRRIPQQALLAWRAPDGRPFDADDRHLLASAADLLFVTLGNQALQRELEMQARTDGLTGLLNRRAFLDDLHRRLDRQSMEPPCIAGAVLFIDLDNFKPLNDRMGHEAGDAALVAVAGLLRDMVRPIDLVARFGGDEFAVWLQDADAEAAAMRAGAICRTAVLVLPGLIPDCALPLTFSIGGAVRLSDGSDTPESLLARADGAMYEAKRAGRNGWRLALPPRPSTDPEGLMHSLAYETAEQRACTGLDSERMALAALPDATPEILYFLAADGTPAVRAAVAANVAAPIQADRLLAIDAVPAVRAEVGRKLAPRAPALAAAQDRLGTLGWRVLCGLAEDAAIRVRAVIAEELKAVPDAPRELILRLAGDAAMEVAEPVLRLSPLLTEADLLALVAVPPDAATITAIARRPALSERLSDAIATTADTPAIAALLGNASAAIHESTLDALIVQAATRVSWQEALVYRPALPPRALQALALCVAGHLLQPLSARRDLPPALAETLRSRVAERLAQQALGDAAPRHPKTCSRQRRCAAT